MIEIIEIEKCFDNKKILNNINYKFETGKINAIIGKSGSGKTILMRSMLGLETIDSGEIYFCVNNERYLATENSIQKLRSYVGVVFQYSALFDWLDVFENVRFPLDHFTNLSESEKEEKVLMALERVDLTNAIRKNTNEISGGMKKRVAIARAIIHNPPFLFMDEPNSGLDPQTSEKIDALILEISKEYDMTVIVNTHDIKSVHNIADNILYLQEGNISWVGKNQDLKDKTNLNSDINDFLKSAIFV